MVENTDLVLAEPQIERSDNKDIGKRAREVDLVRIQSSGMRDRREIKARDMYFGRENQVPFVTMIPIDLRASTSEPYPRYPPSPPET